MNNCGHSEMTAYMFFAWYTPTIYPSRFQWMPNYGHIRRFLFSEREEWKILAEFT